MQLSSVDHVNSQRMRASQHTQPAQGNLLPFIRNRERNRSAWQSARETQPSNSLSGLGTGGRDAPRSPKVPAPEHIRVGPFLMTRCGTNPLGDDDTTLSESVKRLMPRAIAKTMRLRARNIQCVFRRRLQSNAAKKYLAIAECNQLFITAAVASLDPAIAAEQPRRARTMPLLSVASNRAISWNRFFRYRR